MKNKSLHAADFIGFLLDQEKTKHSSVLLYNPSSEHSQSRKAQEISVSKYSSWV